MRYPEAERKPFTDPVWTADMVRTYTGPVFRCTVYWSPKPGREITSDFEAPSTHALQAVLGQGCDDIRKTGTVNALSYGPHTDPERLTQVQGE